MNDAQSRVRDLLFGLYRALGLPPAWLAELHDRCDGWPAYLRSLADSLDTLNEHQPKTPADAWACLLLTGDIDADTWQAERELSSQWPGLAVVADMETDDRAAILELMSEQEWTSDARRELASLLPSKKGSDSTDTVSQT